MPPRSKITSLTQPPEPVALTPLTDLVGYRLRRVSALVQADLAQVLKPHDLRMITFSALAVITANPGLRQAQLADALKVERPNLVVVMDELETRDLIRRDRVPGDRRAYALRATAAGQALCARARAAVDDHETRLFAALPADSLSQLNTALDAILQNQKE